MLRGHYTRLHLYNLIQSCGAALPSILLLQGDSIYINEIKMASMHSSTIAHNLRFTELLCRIVFCCTIVKWPVSKCYSAKISELSQHNFLLQICLETVPSFQLIYISYPYWGSGSSYLPIYADSASPSDLWPCGEKVLQPHAAYSKTCKFPKNVNE